MENINHLKLYFNERNFLHINKLNYRTFIKKIDNNSYYLPFDDNFDFCK